MNGTLNEKARSVVTEALASIDDIATLPEVTIKIIEVVDDADSNPDQLYEVIQNDPALVSRVLRVVNSAFYGLPGQVSNIKRAISLLGLAAIKNIAISASMSDMFKDRGKGGFFSPWELWRHSMAVAVASRKISTMLGRAFNTDEMFMTGLIHDLGLLVEGQIFPEKLEEVCEICTQKQLSFLQAERDIIGATHQDFGSAVTLKWRFPHKLRDGISHHHTPAELDGVSKDLSIILFCADTLCCEQGIGFSLTAITQSVDPDMLETIGLDAENLQEITENLADEVDEALALFSGD